MTRSTEQAGELLRAHGMRSTPQRRAILAAFEDGPAEHLSADEVFARAAESLPDLSRGTVYATLAEFTETGLLAAFGTPEPVRYETNTEEHAHFRCRLCLRIFDVAIELPAREPFERHGFRVERTDLRAEGICKECHDYGAGLRTGVRAITRSRTSARTPGPSATTVVELETPLGPLLLAGTPLGVTRVAFAEHGDLDWLRGLAHGRRKHRAARAHLLQAEEQLDRYFAGDVSMPDCEIDWQSIAQAPALQATLEIPYGTQRSYSDLALELSARTLGRVLGANPIPILIPCHRVIRGIEIPVTYVGGRDRRTWLISHERQHAAAAVAD